MNKLEEIIDLYHIKEKREQIVRNRQKITHLKKEMSDLKINRDVAIYADAINRLEYGEDDYLQIIKQLSSDPIVREYIVLYKEVRLLEQQIIDYYKSIQIGLRNVLTYEETPDIFVYYGMYKDRIITRHIIETKLAFMSEDNTVILPDKELESRRKARHFYNKVSFRYLEELSKDSSFSLENKNVGKVKILSK